MAATMEQLAIPEPEIAEAQKLLAEIQKSALAYVAGEVYNAYWFVAQNTGFFQDFERRADYRKFVRNLVEAPETIGAPPRQPSHPRKTRSEPKAKKTNSSWLSFEF